MPEREQALEAVEAAVRSAGDGSGHCVVIEGSPGLGKTAVLGAASRLRLAGSRETQLLTARAPGPDTAFPFGVALDLLEGALAEPAAGDDIWRGSAALARPVFSRSAALVNSEDPAEVARRVHGLVRLTANLARRLPAVVVVDDVHLADRPSLQFIAELVEELPTLACSVLLATRPPGPGTDPLLHRLRGHPATRLVALAPLSPPAVAAVIGCLRREAHEDTAFAVHHATGGNPLLLSRLASDLGDGPTDAESLLRSGPNATVRRTVEAWMTGLPPAAAAVATLLAVAGEGADLPLLCEVSDLAPDQAAAAITSLAGAGIIVPDGALQFSCPLVRDAVEARLSPAERGLAHAAVARALRARGAAAEIMAPHLAIAPARASHHTVAILREAAAVATGAGATSTAAAYLHRAMAEPAPPGLVREVLAELGVVEAAMDANAAASHLHQAISAAGTDRPPTHLFHYLGHVLRTQGRLDQAAVAFGEVLRHLSGEDEAWRPLLRAELAHLRRYHRRQRIDRSGLEAFLAGWRRGESASRPLLAQFAFDAALVGHDAGEVRRLARDALEGETQGAGVENTTLSAAAGALVFTDDLEEATGLLTAAIEAAESHGAVLAAATARLRRAQARYRQGRLAECIADAEAALGAVHLGWRLHEPDAVGLLGLALLESGDHDRARAVLERDGDGWGANNARAYVSFARARLCLHDADPAGALGHHAAISRVEAESTGALNPALVPWRSDAAAALAALGRNGEARSVAAEDLKLATAFGTPRAVGVALRGAAVAHEGQRRLSLLRRSERVLSESPAVLEHARTLLAVGTALRAAGRRRQAVEILRDAQDRAVRCGALLLAQQALGELVAAGARPRRLAVTGPDALTPSERRCTELAAGGRSNREIAAALFVTPKAVEWHLGNAYRKLGIRSRRELAGVLAGGAPGIRGSS